MMTIPAADQETEVLMSAGSLDAVFAPEALRKLAEESKDRLARGAQRRAAMQAQIEAGDTPTGARVDFLQQTSGEIFKVLCEAAERFNRDFPDDLLSVGGQLDAVMTCRKRLLDGDAVLR